jgi:hypothetical protein
MPEIRTELEIASPPRNLWRVITTFDRFPEWNPFLTEVRGRPEVGSPVDLRVHSRPFPVNFHVTVINADPERELRWRGHFLNDRVVVAEHYFRIEAIDANRSRFIHGEIFNGRFSGLAWRIIERETRRGYRLMNDAFKRRVESGAGA